MNHTQSKVVHYTKRGDITAEIKWIKLSTEIFDHRKIKQLEELPDGDTIIVIWIKLLCLAGTCNDNGCVYFTPDIPYTDQMLAKQFNRPIATIQLALQMFQQYQMIEIVDNFLYISSWQKWQNVEGMDKIREQNRIRQKNWYDKHKALPKHDEEEPNVRNNVSITHHNATDIEEEKELRKKTKNNIYEAFADGDSDLLDALKEFDSFRKLKKKPLTDKAKERLLTRLQKFPREEWTAILFQSIDQGWTDIYELKKEVNNGKSVSGNGTKNSSNRFADLPDL